LFDIRIATETYGDASLGRRLRGGNEAQVREDEQKLARATGCSTAAFEDG
jgi:hypothetical protein